MRCQASCRSAISVVLIVLPILGCGGSTDGSSIGVHDAMDGEMMADAGLDSPPEAVTGATDDASAHWLLDATAGAPSGLLLDASRASDAAAHADAQAQSTVDASMDSTVDASTASSIVDANTTSIADAGTDEPLAKCDFATCAEGCCDANGVCQGGASVGACGSNGLACASCPPGSECGSCPGGAACLSARFCGCTPRSCPSGCCAGGLFGGTCQQGTFDHYCGSGGAGCADCTQNATSCVNCLGGPFGGQGAQAAQNAAAAGAGFCSNQQCVFPAPSVCLYGCVDALGNCQPGSSNTACGNGGQNCVDCMVSGIACVQQQCFDAGDAGVCNAETCPTGCCDYTGQCRQGIAGTACGRSGVNCQDCVLEGQICSNQTCTAPDGGSGCGAFNCNGCCDALGDCIPVNSDTQCGFAGSRCVDCSKLGDRCASGACTNADGATACAQGCLGCCDVSGQCQLGFTDAQCGQVGSACQDCTSLSPPSTCDSSVWPRACASQQTMCPAPYPGCPAALQVAAPVRKRVCSPNDLQNAAAACAAGANATPCISFLFFDLCGACLAQFDYDFVTQVGIRACVAPYLDATCNHNSACIADCVVQSCDACLDPAVAMGAQASTTACDTQVQTGTCAGYFQADQCVTLALSGPAALCSPAAYQNNFGDWLQAVGAAYCGE